MQNRSEKSLRSIYESQKGINIYDCDCWNKSTIDSIAGKYLKDYIPDKPTIRGDN